MSKRKGALIKNDALMARAYFKQMLKQWGIDSMYYPVDDSTKRYNESGEFSALYLDPIPCQVIFDQVPKISTLKKLGWVSELDEAQPLVHVDYDLPGMQVGALFSIEDPLRPGKGRLFRVTKLSLGIIYPANITCQITAVIGDTPENTLQPDTAVQRNEVKEKVVTRPSNDYD